MDPNACADRLLDADTTADRRAAMMDLCDWLRKGGFPPDAERCAALRERGKQSPLIAAVVMLLPPVKPGAGVNNG